MQHAYCTQINAAAMRLNVFTVWHFGVLLVCSVLTFTVFDVKCLVLYLCFSLTYFHLKF